jgi:shikimate kinase
MQHRDKVYIIGFMGSGKTTAGKKLANLLGWSFTDLDMNIEKHTGMTIPEIFSNHGENYFRQVESEMLHALENVSGHVISTGGGTPCFGDNMDFMNSTGLTIYLKLTSGQLRRRLSGSKTDRPLIHGLKGRELSDFIAEKLEFRERWYNRAELVFTGFNTDLPSIYSEVRSRLNI